MDRQLPTQQQLFAALVTTTLFEAIGLFVGAVLIALSGRLGLPMLGYTGIAAWFLVLWAENYSVWDIVVSRFNLSQTVSVFMMSIAEFAAWTIWIVVVLQTNLHWVPGVLLLFVTTHLCHAFQYCFFFTDAQFLYGLRHPLLLGASALEALIGQWLIVQVINTQIQQMTLDTLLLPLIGVFVLFGVEHFIGGQMRSH